jgi:hypothetical protein
MNITEKERLILNDSIDDVDIFLSDMSNATNIDFNLPEFITFKTNKLKEKYNITDEELTLDFLNEINIKNEENKKIRKNNQYKNERASAYPSIQEQLDMQYWDKVNGTTNWEDAIAKVKLDNPKP